MIRLHDTMARKKREFKPADPKRITMYVCGPTVYGRAHIGNARPAVVFDLLRRVLEHEFPDAEVIYARNVTDVDDKIINSANEEGVDVSVITERYERFYLEDMGALGVQPPTIAPHATQEIGPMVAMIAELIGHGHAYAAEGHVLFHVPSDPDYGALSRRDRDAMLAGARVEVAPYKRDPADFVLWKPSEEGVVGWDSPWGRGRPGWHIECSAMIREHFGETIDIHGGGLDLIFPHHENEIAQSRCAHGGAPLARYWVHNGFVDMGAEKMSKSLGNVITVNQLLSKDPRGEIYRLALLSAHYRQPLPWTETLIAQSKARLDRWYRAKKVLKRRGKPQAPKPFISALRDDLNSPLAISIIDEFASKALRLREGAERLPDSERQAVIRRAGIAARKMLACGELLGLLSSTSEDWEKRRADQRIYPPPLVNETEFFSPTITVRRSEPQIDEAIEARNVARKQHDFAEADRIRDELKAEGIVLEDSASGTTWRRE